MRTFTMRRAAVALAVGLGLTAATLASPAAADDLNEETIAAQLCPANHFQWDLETDASGDEAELYIYTFITPAAGKTPARLCTFGIIFTDEGSTLNGSYALTSGSQRVSGAVSGLQMYTPAIIADVTEDTSSATISANGHQKTYELTEVKKTIKTPKSKAQKAKAKASYKKAQKAAKKQYAKSSKNKKAKKVYKAKLAKAKKIYKARIAGTKVVTIKKMADVLDPYALGVTLPLPSKAQVAAAGL